jgi:AcrR family transcriptional regulator
VTLDTQRRKLDATGKLLVQAASKLLADEGPTALTVRRISAAAGVSTMSLYDRFGDKNGVIDELFIGGFEELSKSITRATQKVDGPLESLAAGLKAYRKWALANRTHCTVMFSKAFADYEPSELAHITSARTFEILIEGVRMAMEAGTLRKDVPRDVAGSLWASTHGHVTLELDGVAEHVGLTGKHFDLTVATLLRGFGV